MTSTPALITSRDNPLIKELRKLAQDGSAYRKTSRVWVEGEHLCQACLARGYTPELVVISDRNQPLAPVLFEYRAIKNIVIADTLMREISALDSPASIGCVLQLPENQVPDPQLRTVILDRLQDPGNAGSILRSAAAFGYGQILALKGSVALWSPKVLRAGMGAHFSLRIVEGASLEDVQALSLPLAVTSSHRGRYLHQLLAASVAAPSSSHLLLNKEQTIEQIPGRDADLATFSDVQINWALGHEGQGVSEALEALAQLHIRIAQPGGQESLNVAAAAAICLHASATAALSTAA
jgi:RNA methyltransferase, TrmH family